MLYFYVGSAWDGKSTQVDSIPCRIHGSIRNFIPHAVIDAPVGPVETLSATPKTSGERSEAPPARFPMKELSRTERWKELPAGVPDPDGKRRQRSTGVNKFSIRHVKLDGFTARSMNSEAQGRRYLT